MAITASNNLRKGSKGEDVSALQTALNNYGYGLDVDGSFGAKTLAAVKDYQSKNGLTVDGVVGTKTWGSLTGGTNSQTGTQDASTPATASPTPLQALESNKPTYTQPAPAPTYQAPQTPQPTYTANPTYQQQIATLTEKVLGRQPFQYDLNADMLYNQYKNQYTTLGKKAAADTQAQAAQLSGGYGNSYGVTAANQQYQNYLNRLNDIIPELEQRAYERWLAEGEQSERQLELLQNLENQDYNRYRDTLGDWKDERDWGYGLYRDQYGDWKDDRDFSYNMYQDALAGYRADRAYEYQREQDALDRALQEAALAARGSSGGGSGGRGSGSSKSSSSESSATYGSQAAAVVGEVGDILEAYRRAGDSEGLKKSLQEMVKKGYITAQTATMLANKYMPTTTLTSGNDEAYLSKDKKRTLTTK